MKRLLLVAVLFAGCSPTAPTSRKLDEYVPPVVAPTLKSYADALALSKESGKPVFLYFGAEWCLPCRQMKATTLQDQAVRKRLNDFVVWMVDVDSNRELAVKYKVSSIPAYMIVDSNEKVLTTAGGFRDTPSFLKWLGSWGKSSA